MAAVGSVLFGIFGLMVLLSIAWLFSASKRKVDWRLVATGVVLQVAFAMLVLMVPGGRDVFDSLSHGFVNILSYVAAGSKFIFGAVADERLIGGAIAAGQGETGPDAFKPYGFIFAVQVLPTIIFFAALMGVLYHLGVMQFIVRMIALGITRVMRVSGAETTSVCASIFIGQTEAPLTVKPYLSSMTKSELLTVMIGGMAHIAGGVLAAYVMLLGGGDPEQQAYYAKHLLTASIMAAPATLVIAKILMPETGDPVTLGKVRMQVDKTTVNVIDAAASGAAEGLKLALNVGAMLLAFVALIALLNAPLMWLGEVTGIAGWLGKPTDMSTLLGYLLAPIAWVIGVPWQDAETVGSLIGQKIVVNEFVAYLSLSQIQDTLSEHGRLLATYALCGFANFSSIAIQIGGIGGLAPDRRSDLARFGMRAVLGGTLATLMTATIAGVISRF
ncbi:NupC/NupG family nucleoside CNT transporter [Pseudofulvimonas gallinarii]|jgi:CNT family concentrative nucleoside transporter|uniref:CNT family concentrative nucleoside transporter n=1 Tax=Pseudofulvimonas gallinarii TaxID=634155 RepID=A0A4R3LJX6_9GAMM|nr:nucleoside transporter C-terminal domain-containing protein [Pseudofulvimonas gallinarii]TCS97986.1 CNT family concentrative nucleoside transporter [Pseudofulvimonas gallinarii]THD13139.1 NupC/NupG family nucleoside CNT transporter [Pseudofulvimonas gallinarii]